MLGCAGTPPESGLTHVLSDFVMSSHDRPANAAPELDASAWRPVRLYNVPRPEPVLWLRADVTLTAANLPAGRPLGLLVGALASHEIYWDGEPIGHGGVVATAADGETPGPLEALYALPDRLATPGRHVVAMRTSAHHRHFRPSTGFWYLAIGDLEWLARLDEASNRVALISLSGILMVAVFAAMMFFQDRDDRSFLLLGLLCLVAAALLIAESWRSLVGYTYNWHLLRLVVVTGLGWSLGLLLLLFLASRFPMSGRRWLIGAGVVGATLPVFVARGWDAKALFGFAAVFSLALLWSLRAVRARRPGALLAALGIGACLGPLILDSDRFGDRNLFPCLNVLLVLLLAAHVRQVRRIRMDRDQAILRSARLEIELLRRHLQPHFLMNTLTAVSEWIEEEPEVASRMIESLAEELRTLAEVSNRRLIRVADETRLCRSHLEVMSHRRGRTFSLETDGLDLDARVPPATFHTLVENAITHNAYDRPTVVFRLRSERSGTARHYRFEAPLARPPGPNDSDEGTGLRYVRARLRESFGSAWQLRHGPVGACWRTDISVPLEA